MNINFKKLFILSFLIYLSFNIYAQPKIITALKSAVIPGWGELSKNNTSGYVFLASEIALWSGKIYLQNESDLKIKQANQFAINQANLVNYNCPEKIKLLMEKYDRSGFESGGYNESIVRQAIEQFPYNPEAQTEYINNNKLPSEYYWDWQSRDTRKTYQIMRKDSAHYKDYAKAVTGVIIVNHIASFFNTLRITNKESRVNISSSFDKDLNPFIFCNVKF
ncbi:MAG: hypothetical protein PHY08_04035 [Candidatus Cloacimonetes bacterium]|jgi:hypothetical protein|nr:hypothetical protein [Candidatus Cloacimonadota bacterium]